MGELPYIILGLGIIAVGILAVCLVVAVYTAIPDQDRYDTYDN